jgi:predicted dehydrogenase
VRPGKQSLESAIGSGQYGRLNYVVHRFTRNSRVFGSWGRFRREIPGTLLVQRAVHHFDIPRALRGSNAKSVHSAHTSEVVEVAELLRRHIWAVGYADAGDN